MSEPEASITRTEQQFDDEARLARAQEVAGHLRAIRLVRTELLVNGGRFGNERALRLRGPEQFFHDELTELGHLALLDETTPEEALPGRKALVV